MLSQYRMSATGVLGEKRGDDAIRSVQVEIHSEVAKVRMQDINCE